MKKVKILLSAVAVVAVVAGAVASNARVNHIVYTPNAVTPSICDVPQAAKTFFADPQGPNLATLVKGLPCVRGTIVATIN